MATQDFDDIKTILSNAEALARPNYALPLCLDASVADTGLTANVCLNQQHQGERHVRVLQHTVILDPIKYRAPLNS